MLKSFRLIGILLFPILGLISCGSDEPEDPSNKDPWGNNGSDSVTDVVIRNISSSVSYSDYGWNITINSKLANAFPGKTLIYGTECGYGSYQYYHHFNFKKDYVEKTDGKGNMTICFPVFAGDEYANEYLFYDSYKYLQAQMAKGYSLDSDERDLYNEILKSFRAKESSAKYSYCGRLYVIIDGSKYFFKTYGQAPSTMSNIRRQGPEAQLSNIK